MSNLLLSVLVARTAPTAEFGAFAIAFTVYQFALGISRAAVGEPMLVRLSGRDVGTRAFARTVGAGALIGCTAGAACLALAIISPMHTAIYVSMAAIMPVAMMVDAARYWEFARGRPRGAFLVDLTWLLAQLGCYFAFLFAGPVSATMVITSWGIGATLALIAISAIRKSVPKPIGGAGWIWSNRDLSLRFSAEYLAISGVQQSVVYFSVLFAGLGASAAIRGGQVILGPLSVLSMGIAVVALPSLARLSRAADRHKMLRTSGLISGGLLVATSSYAILAFLIPERLGVALLGESWSTGHMLLPLLALQLAAGNLAYGATAGLRALEKAKLSLRLRWITAPLIVAAVGIGAATGGPSGALVAACTGGFLQACAWWIAYVVASKDISKDWSEDATIDDDPL